VSEPEQDGAGEALQQRAGIQLNPSGLCVEISQVHKNAFKRVATFLWAFARISNFIDDRRALRREMHSTVERHDFLDRSRTEIDAVVLFQKTLVE